jgi:hypothetical protein
MNVRTVIAVTDVTACQAIAVDFSPKTLGPKNVRRTSARMSRMKMTCRNLERESPSRFDVKRWEIVIDGG